MAQAEEFMAPYLFKRSDVTVVLRHSLNKSIRQKPGHPHHVDPDGEFGRLARWVATTREREGVLEVQLKNENSNGYLRIKDNEIDGNGKGGKFTWFRVHIQNVGFVKLESCESEGKYIAVDKNGIRIGQGGPWCRLNILREGPRPPFSTPYLFMRRNTVVIEHRGCMNMKVAGANSHALEINGGTGEYARFEAIPDGDKVQLKSLKNGQFLRIKDGSVDCGGKGGPFTHFKVHPVDAPNQVRLESVHNNGRFVTVDLANKHFKPTDGQHKNSFLTFYRDN